MTCEIFSPIADITHKGSDWFDPKDDMGSRSGADTLIRVNRKDVPVLEYYNKQAYSILNEFSPVFPLSTWLLRGSNSACQGMRRSSSFGGPRRLGREDPDCAGPGVGPGGVPHVCRAVYVGECDRGDC